MYQLCFSETLHAFVLQRHSKDYQPLKVANSRLFQNAKNLTAVITKQTFVDLFNQLHPY